MRSWAAALALLLGIGMTACIRVEDGRDAVITVSPRTAPMDEPVAIRVAGLPAGKRTTVTATAVDAGKVGWTATADFTAGRDGTVDLGQPPVGGAWQGANPMGLFTSMTSDDAGAYGFGPALTGTYDVTITVSLGDRTVATTTATRQTPGALGVTTKDLRVPADGVYGTLFRPKDTATRKPAMLLFGGSEGGLSYPAYGKAALLAAHGYPTLAIAYFGAPGLPATLTEIPLEYFRKALLLLRAQPGVDPAHVLVSGASYGGEGSLLIAATYPDLVTGVVAEVPNSYVDAGPGSQPRSAWSLGGKPVLFAGASKFGSPAAEVDPRAYIPLDRIRGPIVLACGQLDVVWPSCRNVDDAVARLSGRAGVTVLKYADAGHYIGVFPPYTSPTERGLTKAGGSVRGTVAANVDLQKRTLAVLAAQ